MIYAAIRELQKNLRHYVLQIEAGERVVVKAHGRVVAELVAPMCARMRDGERRYEVLVASGIIVPAAEPDASLARWPDIALSSGAAAKCVGMA